MKRALLTLGLLIGLLANGYSQDATENTDKVEIHKATIYHDNGEIAQTGFITSDKKVHGVWKSFDTKGNLKSVGEYNNGKKVGVWVFCNTSFAGEYNHTKVEFGSDNRVAEVQHSNDYYQIADTEIEE